MRTNLHCGVACFGRHMASTLVLKCMPWVSAHVGVCGITLLCTYICGTAGDGPAAHDAGGGSRCNSRVRIPHVTQ